MLVRSSPTSSLKIGDTGHCHSGSFIHTCSHTFSLRERNSWVKKGSDNSNNSTLRTPPRNHSVAVQFLLPNFLPVACILSKAPWSSSLIFDLSYIFSHPNSVYQSCIPECQSYISRRILRAQGKPCKC